MRQKEQINTGNRGGQPMTDARILNLAREVAGNLGIAVKNPQRILLNMRPKSIPITTILCNKNHTLWIDKYYIAYSKTGNLDVRYVYITRNHIKEELPEIKKMLKKSGFTDFITLTGIQEQMRQALKVMTETGKEDYVFDRADSRKPPVEVFENSNIASGEPMILTLCRKCAQQFYDSADYLLKRVDPNQIFMETCTYCQSRSGFDYKVKNVNK